MQAYARTTDPETSHEAAVSFTISQLTRAQQDVYDVLWRYGPMEDVRLVRVYQGLASLRSGGGIPIMQSPSGIRSRRAALVEAGLVEWTGDKVKIGSRNHRVWKCND